MPEQENRIKFNTKNLSEEERTILCIQEVTRQSLYEIDRLQEKRRSIVKKIQSLKMDIRDFKTGRINRLVERHEKDPESKVASVVNFEKIEGENYDNRRPWSPKYIMFFVLQKMMIKVRLSGFLFNAHTPGSYDINGKIRNL